MPELGSSALSPTTLDARDLRCGGSWSRRQRLKNWLIYNLVVCSLWLLDRLPAAWLVRLMHAAGWMLWRIAPGLRQRALVATQGAIAETHKYGVVRNSFAQAGRNLALCLLLRRRATCSARLVTLSPEDEQLLHRLLARNEGLVFVSPHLGPFELIAARVADLGLLPAAVTRESYDPRLDPIIDHHRKSRRIQVIHRGHPGAALRIVRALRDGRIVGFLPDLPGRAASVEVPFLGRSRRFALGPQRIALRVGCPIVVGLLRVHRGGLRLQLIHVESDNLDDRQLTEIVARHFETAILETPEQWLWMACR